MSALYAWLRRHPRLVDGVLAVALVPSGLGLGIIEHSPVLIVATFALTIPVIFRRAHPTGAFATAIAAGGVQAGLDTRIAPPDLAILILLYTLAAYTTRRKSVLGLGLCLLGSAVEITGRLHPLPPQVTRADWLLVGSMMFAGPSLIAWVLGDSMRYRRAYYANLEERAARLERDRDAQAQIAATAERARIARELHDVVAHNVSVMVVQADGAAYALGTDPGRAREALAAISATGRQALTEMRAMLGVLRSAADGASGAEAGGIAGSKVIGNNPGNETNGNGGAGNPVFGNPVFGNPVFGNPVFGNPVFGHGVKGSGIGRGKSEAALAPLPGVGQLDDLLAQARAAGLPVSCAIEGDPRSLPDGTALATYRIIQESLTNVRKHAGLLASADIVLRYARDAVEITVTDDGLGCAAACDGAGHGLTGMRERAALYGGSVRAGPRPGGGFEVAARLPTRPVRAGAA